MLASMKRIKSIVNSSESRKLRVNKILRVIYAVIPLLQKSNTNEHRIHSRDSQYFLHDTIEIQCPRA